MELEFIDATLTPTNPLTGAERQRRYRIKGGERQAKKTYRHKRSMHTTDTAYLARKFRVWDGEGATLSDGRHIYTMFAAKLDGETSTDIIDPTGLATGAILNFILETATDDALNVIYGGSYDFNMFLADLSEDDLRAVYENRSHVWHGFRIMWRRGKSFYLCYVDAFGKKVGRGVTIYDVIPFFQCSFVKACDDYLGDGFVGRDTIIENKAKRSNFVAESLSDVRAYNDLELENLIHLCNELRLRLNKVGLRPRRWDGPGAVAAALLLREGVKEHMAVSPPEVASAARFAYAGGRFEVIKYGIVPGKPAYEYDVNSAYPAALLNVPSLTQGHWRHETGEDAAKVYPFAIYHLRSEAALDHIPAPLFRRDVNGTICYPMTVTGWYWTPEYEAAKAYSETLDWYENPEPLGNLTVLECWRFVPDVDNVKPFAFIEPLYNKRRALKKAGDGAHVGIKLALNSLYGKLAQQVGAEQKADGSWRIPPFHQIEWAGYTTSYCRAKVLMAALRNINSVIAFETDAVFMTEPIDVPVSSNLGEFEQVKFTGLAYISSGLYFGSSDDKPDSDPTRNIAKTRGVDRGHLTIMDVIAKIRAPLADERECAVTLTRFNGAGVALAQGFDKWRRWEDVTKHIYLGPSGKRVHLECWQCNPLNENYDPALPPVTGVRLGMWHTTFCPILNDGHSVEFPVEWENPQTVIPGAETLTLAETRNEENFYDDDEW
jgi:hypothetical protein